VLMHNPCSIAGMVILLAGSEMVERKIIPKGAEWMKEENWKQKGIFEGWLFSLGYWEERVVKDKNARSGGVEREDGEDTEVRKRFGIDVGRAEVTS